MKQYLLMSFFFITSILTAQNVFEYNSNNEVSFKVYTEINGKFYKISKSKDFKQDTPENVALSSFFAYSNEIASKLYLDKNNYTALDNEEFDLIKATKSKDAFIQLLHKMNYTFQGNKMAYIMFIAKVKDIPFRFPTVLSLIKKEDKWYIHQRPNQQKFTDCFMMFKSCVLSNLIQGKSNDKDVQDLILKTRSKEGGIDFIKLFDELVIIQKNEQLTNKLTAAQNLNCKFIQYENEITSNILFTNIYKNLSVSVFNKQDAKLISQIKKNGDDIVLISKLKFEYSNKTYHIIKYKEGNSIKYFRIDNNKIEQKPIKDLLFLFKNLNTAIFKDLTPSLNKKPITNSELYKKTRGVYNVLNISKLYELYQTNKSLFIKYIE